MLSNINHFGLFLLLACLTGCSSCEDRGQITVVEGFVTDVETGNPAVGASVVLWFGFTQDFLPTGGELLKDFSAERITDSTGFYSLSFFNTTDEFYRMQVVPNEFFNCSERQEVEIGERNELDFAVVSQDTLLELTFVQSDFENNPDSVAVSIHFDACDVSRFELNNYILSTNLEMNNTLQIFSQPNAIARLDFSYFENGVLVKNENTTLTIGTTLRNEEIEY